MNVSTAEELMLAVSELRTLFPEWRMGQVVANVVTAADGTDASAIWDMEDEQLLAAARRLIEGWSTPADPVVHRFMLRYIKPRTQAPRSK